MSASAVSRAVLPDPRLEPTISVRRAAEILGVSKDAGYDACSRGQWPHTTVGRRVRILTAKWLSATGLSE